MAQRIIFLLLFIVIIMAGGSWWWLHRNQESTDDAYIKADILPIMSRVNGSIQDILVQDNQAVKANMPLLSLDPRNFKIMLEQTKAELISQQAVLTHLFDRQKAQLALIAAVKSTTNIAKIKLTRAQQQMDRLLRLSTKQYVSQDAMDAARLARDAANATLIQTDDQVKSQQAQLNVIIGEKPTLEAKITIAKTKVEQAQLQLSYTHIKAPRAGIVTSRQVQLGQTVNPNARLLSLVTSHLWIRANFKETQLTKIRVGQRVQITVDALSSKIFTGKVKSFSAATGSEFALFSPQNATGNFTKVVQRLPIRITFDPQQDLNLLKPGMSVTTTVYTK